MKLNGPQIALAVQCAVLLLVGALYVGHSVESMDVRTYAQMIRGVAEHGYPYWDNGPIDRFPELVVPWGVPNHGHIWGIYGPLYPYLLAPVYALGGLRRVSGFTFAMLAPLAIVTFLLGRRVLRNPWSPALAAIAVVISTPILAKSLEMTPFPLTAVLATLATYLTVCLIQSSRPSPWIGFACGIAWEAASAAHALCFPMAVAALAVVAAAPDVESGVMSIRTGRSRLAPVLAGFIAAILPVAYLNHVRFSSWNPVSYGPVPWTGMVNPALYKMNLVNQAMYSAPTAAFLVAVFIVAVVVHRRTRNAYWLLGVLIAAGLVAFAVEPLRVRFVRYAVVALGYLVDMSLIDLAPMYQRAPDGLGQYFGGWVAKSTLQCTPILALAPLALRHAGKDRWPMMAILIPGAALYASFIMRANLEYADALGFPWVYLRYTLAPLPAFFVASFVVVERLEPTRRDLWSTISVGAALAVVLALTHSDSSLAKRVLLLVLPLVGAAAVVVTALRSQSATEPSNLARLMASLVGALGIGIALGHDLRANVDTKIPCDAAVESFSRVVPQRFALVGYLGQFDVLLTTAATHDVEYADLLRLSSLLDVRPLLDHWRSEGRPIYFVWGSDLQSPWPDASFTREPHAGIFKLNFAPNGPSDSKK